MGKGQEQCFSALRRAVLGSINQVHPDPCPYTLFQCSPTSRVGVNLILRPHLSALLPVSVLSDEPCWGQYLPFSVVFIQFDVSVLSDEPCWGQSCSLSAARADVTGFSALRRAVLGSMLQREQHEYQYRLFQCSPTSRVGVNIDFPWGSWNKLMFQCSPTSRVGVNRRGSSRSFKPSCVSVLSDEPCWGQCDLGAGEGAQFGSFSALRRAVLGSMRENSAIW